MRTAVCIRGEGRHGARHRFGLSRSRVARPHAHIPAITLATARARLDAYLAAELAARELALAGMQARARGLDVPEDEHQPADIR